MPKFIKKLINILPGVIGIAQSLLPPIKDLVVAVVRIIAILPFLWSVDKPIIDKVNAIYDSIFGVIEKIKNWLLQD